MPKNQPDTWITPLLLDWFDHNRRQLPWRQDRTAYGTWISETMLQQTKVVTVIPYYQRFMELFPTISSLATAPQEAVYKAWEGLGYYSRARNLQKGAKVCVQEFDGKLPTDFDKLLTVPGIGPYTAGAIASLAFGIPVVAVDGNAIRVMARLFALFIYPQDVAGKKSVTQHLNQLLPQDRAGDFNEGIMDLGATICTPRSPLCSDCPLISHCQANLLGVQSELPLKKTKKISPIISYTIVVIKKGNQILLHKRPPTGLLANLFEFDSFPGHLTAAQVSEELYSAYGIVPEEIASLTALDNSSHVFSHLKWEMMGYQVELLPDQNKKSSLLPLGESPLDSNEGVFVTLEKVASLPFPSALKAYTSVVLPTKLND